MDEKAPSGAMMHHTPKRARLLIAFASLVLCLLLYLHIRPFQTLSDGSPISADTARPVAPTEHKLVPLEAHIMSKCPDARDCLRDLILPTMQRVHDKVNFTLSFLGTPTANDGVDCKHGPRECMGNILELCAAKLYPDPKTYLGFTMCITRDYKSIPERSLIEDCALEHAIDAKALNDCAVKDDGGFGIGLLRDSVRRSSDVRSPIKAYEVTPKNPFVSNLHI